MIQQTPLFENLTAPNLVAYLVDASRSDLHITNSTNDWDWHICWLNNDHQPVIGLLPRVSWTVMPKVLEQSCLLEKDSLLEKKALSDNVSIDLITTQRPFLNNKNKDTTQISSQSPTTFNDWINTLIDYVDKHAIIASRFTENQETDLTENQALSNQVQTNDAIYDNGFMGFIGYDIGAKALSPQSNIKLANQPCAFLGHYDIYLKPFENAWQLHTQADTDSDIVAMVQSWLQALDIDLQSTSNAQSNLPAPSINLTNQWQLAQYKEAFNKTQEYLYAGDSYQINLTQKWQGALNQSTSSQPKNSQSEKHQSISCQSTKLANYLPALYANTKAPFAGYVGIDIDGYGARPSNPFADSFELLSCSPELFVTFVKENNESHHEIKIITKPIKGTRPRGDTPIEDEQLKSELADSEKDHAENVMIVDLLRNDLGKYAKVGSVQVPKLFAIETFSNVHHMVSTVTATIKEDVHPLTVLFDSLPAGSITGTPKKRAVEIISELEAEPRGAYCGTMGYMNFDGSGQWNVLIRSLQANTHNQTTDINLWAGGGITVGSECDAEYQECFDKVGNLLKVLQGDG